MSTLPAQQLALVSLQGLTLGQVSLINYVETMGLMDNGAYVRNPYDTRNIPERLTDEIKRGERSVWDAPLCAAGGVVLQAMAHQRTLLDRLGVANDGEPLDAPWRNDDRFVVPVSLELEEMARVVSGAESQVKAWRQSLSNFHDAHQYFDVSRDLEPDDALNVALADLQGFFTRKILRAKEVEEIYGLRTFAGVEFYFDVARRRHSGTVSRAVDK